MFGGRSALKNYLVLNNTCSNNNILIDEERPVIRIPEQSALETAPSVLVELRRMDKEELEGTSSYTEQGCTCTLGPDGSPYCHQFSKEQYRDIRSQCAELSHAELDMVIMGQIMATTSSSDLTRHSLTHCKKENRQRSYTSFYHQGLRVCRKTFIFLHGISEWRFKALKSSVRRDGLAPRVHGNTKRAPSNALSFNDIQHVVTFIVNYAEDHAILLPGRIPGYRRSDLQLLPTSTTRHSVWKAYYNATATSPPTPHPYVHCVAYPTFCRLWRQLLPQIVPTQPMTDLCAVCHRNSVLIMRSANLPEVEKTQVSNTLYANTIIIK